MHKKQAIEDLKKYKGQATEDLRTDDPCTGIIDIVDKADNKTDKFCRNSNNHNS